METPRNLPPPFNPEPVPDSKPRAPPVPARPPRYAHDSGHCKGVSLLRGAGCALRASLAQQSARRWLGSDGTALT